MRIFVFYRAPPVPPSDPKIAKSAKNKATGKIPITVNAMFLAFSHSAFPEPAETFPTAGFGQLIASETSEKIKMPIRRATAAPIKDKMNPRLSTIDRFQSVRLFKILIGGKKK